MYPDSWIYCGFKSCNFDLWWKQNGWHDSDLRKINGIKLTIYAQTAFKFGNSKTGFVLQQHILISVIIFVAYELNLPLNMEKPHYRSQRTGEWSLILAHVRRLIYLALTYITVPLLRPHQPRYIESTLYLRHVSVEWVSD